MNNSVNAIGVILPSLWKLYPFNISNGAIKILSIILWCASDFKIKIKIIKKDNILTFFCLEKKDKKTTITVRIVSGALKINRIFVGFP